MAIRFANVQFHPWIGAHYQNSPFGLRILVLGESHYGWEAMPEDEASVTRRSLETGRETGRFWQAIAGLLAAYKPDGTPNTWDCVAFYNYVQHIVGDQARVRPEDWMWTSKTTVQAFKQVLAECQPERILVIGKTNWRFMAGGTKYFPEAPPGIENSFTLPSTFSDEIFGESHAYWYPTDKGQYALAAPIFHPAYPSGFYAPATPEVVSRLLEKSWTAPHPVAE